jgi:hypothetical protein
MSFTSGQWGPDTFIDADGNTTLIGATAAALGYVCTIDALGNMTVTGPASDAVTLTITPASGATYTETIRVQPLVSELAVVKDNASAGATGLTAHLADAIDAHDASAISYAGGTGISATDVEGALDELANEKLDTTTASATYAAKSRNIAAVYDLCADHADGALALTSSLHTWLTTGATTPTYSGGKIRVAGGSTGYFGVVVGSTPQRMSAEVTWESGTTGGVLAMIMSADATLSLQNMLHFISSTTTWTIAKRVGGGVLTNVATGTYDVPLTADSATISKYDMVLQGTTAIVYLPDGQVVKATDASFATIAGGTCIWESSYTAGQVEPRFVSVQAVTRSTADAKEPYATLAEVAKAVSRFHDTDGNLTSRQGRTAADRAMIGLASNGFAGLVLGTDTTIFRQSAGTLATAHSMYFLHGTANQILIAAISSAPGIWLGNGFDTRIRRGAAGVCDIGKLGVTNSAAATTLGSVTKKVEVFDGSGTSLGYVPVYGSIT